MTAVVRPSEFAQDEIKYYLRRYEAERAGLGDRLWNDIQHAVEIIAEHPLSVSRFYALAGVCGAFLFVTSRFSSDRRTGSHESQAILLAFSTEVRLKSGYTGSA